MHLGRLKIASLPPWSVGLAGCAVDFETLILGELPFLNRDVAHPKTKDARLKRATPTGQP